jgi:C-terminal processing protease CtpA/Prc
MPRDTAPQAVAAALQDSGRAVLVGEPAGGDGQVTGIVRLPEGKEALVLRTGRVERTTDRGWPLRPDHTVALSRDQFGALAEWMHQKDLTELPPGARDRPPADPQLDKAVELLRAALRAADQPENQPTGRR